MLLSKTRRKLAAEYGFHPRTLKTKLEEKGIHLPPGIITPAWCLTVYEALGDPDNPDPVERRDGRPKR